MVMDCKEVGLKAGLEIHQQLNTSKLFCRCPSILRNDEPDFFVERKLNPVVGETKEVDIAVVYEKQKDKTFSYQVFDTNCLVELDEEPPHEINNEALRIALQIALLLDCKIFPVSQIMRKSVIDGSNTSGFQRSVLIAYDGFIETSQGRVGIETVALEEDSARKIKDEYKTRVYSLDRLGIPLVEITTKPDLKTPEQIKEAALKIGEILRACEVKRGIGTIRQDVNISIEKGNRVEIKGFQDTKIMISTIENEVKRQKILSELKGYFKKTKLSELNDLTQTLMQTDCNIIKQSALKNKKTYAFKLSNFSGILGKEICENTRVGTDLARYAKSFSGIQGIIHSDENLEKYGLSQDEIKAIKDDLKIRDRDSFILIVAEKKQAELAFDAIKKRIELFSNGVPKDVRQSNSDSTTCFLRPMPGASRMYPETDCELLRIKKTLIDELKSNLPMLASENKRYLKKFGLNDELIRLLLRREKVEQFKELINSTDYYDSIAKSLTIFPAEISKKQSLPIEGIEEKLNTDVLSDVLEKIGKDISPNELKNVLYKIVQGKSLSEAIEKKEINLSEEIKKLIKEKPDLSEGAYMGLIMSKFRGYVSGKEVMEELKKHLF